MNLQSILLFMDSIWSWWYGTKGLFIPSLFCYGKALVSKFQSIIPDWMDGEAGSAGPRVHVHSLADQRSKWGHFYSF